MLDNRMTSALRRAGLAFAVVAATLTSACEDNIFDGPGGGDAVPPEITSLTGPETIRAGETLFLDIVANSPSGRPIDSVSVSLESGATQRDTTIAVTSGVSINESLAIPMSATLPGTELVVTARAIDDIGTESEPFSITIAIEDSEAPTVQIVRPVGPEATGGDTTAVGTGSDLRVEARVTDASGIEQVRFIGLALRGDPELGTDEEVIRFAERVVTFPRPGVDTFPTDTVIRRDLPQVGDSTEAVHIIVEATDVFGNVTADTVPVFVGGPDVQILRPSDGATHNEATDLTVRVAVADPGGIESVTLTFSGSAVDLPVPIVVEVPLTGQPTSDTITHILPATSIVQGSLTISASASNVRGINAPATPVNLSVVSGGQVESNAPQVSFTIDPQPRLTAPLPRLEMLDTITINASADDQGGSGVALLGVNVIARVDGRTQTATISAITTYDPPRSNPDTTIRLAVRDIYDAVSATLAESVELPDSLELRLEVFAQDVAGNADTVRSSAGSTSQRGFILTVAGYTARLPGRGIISDAVIDTTAGRESLYLSNFTQSRVDVLMLDDSTFLPGGILAGAQPWGLFISDDDGTNLDTLIVANSGGTNLSKIPLHISPLREAVLQRVHTPEAVIYQFDRELDQQLNARFAYQFFGFSDRPQFVAQGISGALLYSTVPTAAAAGGTIRMALKQPGWQSYEDYFLFPGGDPSDEEDAESFLILNVDRALVIATDTGDLIRIVDHVPGFPSSVIDVIGTETTVFNDAIAAGSDVVKCSGSFRNDAVALQDTTFVAASGDESWIAFGEGATAEAGRIIMFDGSVTTPLDPFCLATGQSHEIQITDLVHNASERVTGLGLNNNGTLGVARGDFAAYFFDRALRLEGMFSDDINPGGFGAALHPDHDEESGGSDATTLSFVGTAESTVKIVDTYHFFARGEVPIRDRIVGPLRATRPLPSDNAGLTCPTDDRCVVVKLFGVTQSEGSSQPDGVVIIDVREADID